MKTENQELGKKPTLRKYKTVEEASDAKAKAMKKKLEKVDFKQLASLLDSYNKK